MRNKSLKTCPGFTAVAVLGAALLAVPVAAHHSFAMYDRSQIVVFTGVVSGIDPNTNHLMVNFAPMNDARDGVLRDADGNPIIWALEMQAASAVASYGITKTGFPPGTIFSGAIHPARNGDRTATQYMGDRSDRVLIKCPGRNRPAAGKHCDSVEGATLHGTAESLPEPTRPLESP
ncbi:MAG: DUF6152 family protein [Gammaproteobacteria bacterium]|jgi:hypothetical protein